MPLGEAAGDRERTAHDAPARSAGTLLEGIAAERDDGEYAAPTQPPRRAPTPGSLGEGALDPDREHQPCQGQGDQEQPASRGGPDREVVTHVV